MSQAQEIRVMGYNLEGAVGAGAAPDTPQSRALARVVQFQKPDLLLLNELRADGTLWAAVTSLQNWVNAFLPHFGGVAGTSYFTHVSTQTDGFIRNAVVSRFPLLDPVTHDDGLRGLLSVGVQLPDSRRLQVFLTHWVCCEACTGRQSQAQRAAQIIQDWATTNSGPFLVAGDLNEDEERPICPLTADYRPITTLRSAGLDANRLTDPEGARFTWGTRNPAPFLPARFDYLLPASNRLAATGGWVFNSYAWQALGLLEGVSGLQYDDVRTGSDHFPVVGLFSIDTGPTPPRDLVARAPSPHQVELAWVPGGSDHHGYRIERGVRPEGAFVPIASAAAGQTNFMDAAVRPAALYFYRIVATNAAGASASRPIGVVTPADREPLIAVFHSPVVSTNNPWPNADDGTEVFDFDTSGGSLPLAAGALNGGFGALTRLVFNHDDHFLYVGIEGLSRYGDNALLVFLDTRPGGVLWLGEKGRPLALGEARNLAFSEGFQPDVAMLLGGRFGDGANFPQYWIGSRDFGQGVYALARETNAHFTGFSTVFGSSPISQFGADNLLNTEVKLSRAALGLYHGRRMFKAAAVFVGGSDAARRYVSGRVWGAWVAGAHDGTNFGFQPVRIDGAPIVLAGPEPVGAGDTALSLGTGEIELQWIAATACTYTIQVADALPPRSNGWTSVWTLHNAAGPSAWTDNGPADLPLPTAVSQRFYRLMITDWDRPP